MNKPELLAPAGDLNTLKVAIQAGADAVYIGGRSFGARYFATNFTDEDLKEAGSNSDKYSLKNIFHCSILP